MGRPTQEVDIFTIQDRRAHGKSKPWVVRWRIDGQQRTKAFRTRAEADRHRSYLVSAATTGQPFDAATGEPTDWSSEADSFTVFSWARRWLAEQWPEWQPRTRRSALESISRFVPLAVSPAAPRPPADLRLYLMATLPPDSTADPAVLPGVWLDRHSLRLNDLDKATLARVDLELGRGDNGESLSAHTATRRRTVAHACIRRAVQLDLLPADPWPPASSGRARRKVHRTRRSVDHRSLPDPATMGRILAAMASHQPGAKTYQQMTAVVYFAGLRPSEVIMLRRRSLDLPVDGDWGHIDVTEADIDNDVPGEPKTGPRTVPIPPVLVSQLRRWVEDHALKDDDLLFRTRTGGRPSSSNWTRAWQRALRIAGVSGLRIYDCRHAAATTWLASGAPLGEVARRLGHTVETLVSTYVGALTGDETLTNGRIATVLDTVFPSGSEGPEASATGSCGPVNGATAGGRSDPGVSVSTASTAPVGRGGARRRSRRRSRQGRTAVVGPTNERDPAFRNEPPDMADIDAEMLRERFDVQQMWQ